MADVGLCGVYFPQLAIRNYLPFLCVIGGSQLKKKTRRNIAAIGSG